MAPLAGLAGLILGVVVGTVQTLLGVHGGGAWTLIGFSEMGLYLGIPAGRICLLESVSISTARAKC
jgi:hypothetical protein